MAALAAPTQWPAPHGDEVDLLDALNTALGVASYYDICLATTEEDFDCHLCLFNVGSLETVVLWPALLFETQADLMAQLEDDGPKGTAHRGRLSLLANRLIRQREGLSMAFAAFVHLLGKADDDESLLVVGRDMVKEGRGLVFDFEVYHQFMFGKALKTLDIPLIKAYNIAIAKRGGLLTKLKRHKENLVKHRQLCVERFVRMSTKPTPMDETSCFSTSSCVTSDPCCHLSMIAIAGDAEGSMDESSCFSTSSCSVSSDLCCHLSTIAIAGDETSLVTPTHNTVSSNSCCHQTMVTMVASDGMRRVSTSQGRAKRPITPLSTSAHLMASQPTTVAITGDETSFVAPTPNTVSSDSGCHPANGSHISDSPETVRQQRPSSPLSRSAQVIASEPAYQITRGIDRIRILEMNSKEDMKRVPIRDLLLAEPKASYCLKLPGRGSIQSTSMQTLCPGKFVNDEIMNAYLLKVLKPKLSNADNVYIFNTFFMSQLLSTGNDGLSTPKFIYGNVKNWDRLLRRQYKILGMKVIFVPINYQNSHWLFLLAFLPTLTIHLFDSQGNKSENRIFLDAMQQYLKAKMSEYKRTVPDDDCWTLMDMSDKCPRQYNGYDCGIFVMVNITLLSQGVPLTEETYSERSFQLNQTRERIALLLWCNSTNLPYPSNNDARRPMQTRHQSKHRILSEASSTQMQLSSSSKVDTAATPTLPSTEREGAGKSVLSLKATARKRVWQAVFLGPIPDEFICSLCGNLVVSATQMGCCHAICCALCLPLCRHCPCGTKVGSRSGAVLREDIDASLGEAFILCPNNCGWLGVMNSLPDHHIMCRAEFYGPSTSVHTCRMEDSSVSHAMNQVKQLDLGERIKFRHKQASKLNRDQGARMFLIAATLARPHYHTVMNDATSRTSRLAMAVAMLTRIVRPHELVVNSISGKDYGGGVHQTFSPLGWIYIQDWILTHSIAIFGDLVCFRCVDIGCGLNLPAWFGTIVDKRMKWMGIEIDGNRCFLASQIAIEALPKLTDLLERQISIGIIQGDGTSFFNLRGTHICFLWDRAHPSEVVYSSYESMWRSYKHPFILVQSICWWKERSPYLHCFFDKVQECGISKHIKFTGSGSGDTLVLAFVASPKATPSTEDFVNIAPLNNTSPSLFDILDSKFYDTASSLHQHVQLHTRLLNGYEKAKRGWKPKKITTVDEHGNMVTKVLRNPI